MAPRTAGCARASASGIAVASPSKNTEIVIRRSVDIVFPNGLFLKLTDILLPASEALANGGRKSLFDILAKSARKINIALAPLSGHTPLSDGRNFFCEGTGITGDLTGIFVPARLRDYCISKKISSITYCRRPERD
jgi:hypothetical protein